MDIDWSRYKQILLNDRSVFYKPNRELLEKLRSGFRDINVFGFGKYPQTNCWYILAESKRFPENQIGVNVMVSITDVMIWSKPLLSVVTQSP